MSQFHQNAPFHQEPFFSEEAVQNYSAKKQALFKHDPPSHLESRLSLSDYIAKYLHSDNEPHESKTLNPASPFLPVTAVEQNHTRGIAGLRLNNLDIEMGAGLEQYLPTPLFRLRVIKKRLQGEIEALRNYLNKYERVQHVSTDLQQRVQALQEKLQTLEAHAHQVDAELASLLAEKSLLYQVSRAGFLWQNLTTKLWKETHAILMKILYGVSYQTIKTANNHLRTLQELFSVRIQEHQSSDVEISQLLNQYEQTLNQLETAEKQLKTQIPLQYLFSKSQTRS